MAQRVFCRAGFCLWIAATIGALCVLPFVNVELRLQGPRVTCANLIERTQIGLEVYHDAVSQGSEWIASGECGFWRRNFGGTPRTGCRRGQPERHLGIFPHL